MPARRLHELLGAFDTRLMNVFHDRGRGVRAGCARVRAGRKGTVPRQETRGNRTRMRDILPYLGLYLDLSKVYIWSSSVVSETKR